MTSPIEISPDPRRKRGYVLRTACRLAPPPEEVFPFFADPDNLGYLTPDWLHLEILSRQPETACAGMQIHYKIRLHGIPFRWHTEICDWDAPRQFVDEARRSPYRYWQHLHRFLPDGNGTLADDVVYYDVPGGRLVHDLLVRRNLVAIFTYRRDQLQKRFGTGSSVAPPSGDRVAAANRPG